MRLRTAQANKRWDPEGKLQFEWKPKEIWYVQSHGRRGVCRAKRTNLRLLIFGRTAAAAAAGAGAGPAGLEIQVAHRRHGELRAPPSVEWSGAEENEGGRRPGAAAVWWPHPHGARLMRVLAFIAADVCATCPWWTETGSPERWTDPEEGGSGGRGRGDSPWPDRACEQGRTWLWALAHVVWRGVGCGWEPRGPVALMGRAPPRFGDSYRAASLGTGIQPMASCCSTRCQKRCPMPSSTKALFSSKSEKFSVL
jgi:hypothetical protein